MARTIWRIRDAHRADCNDTHPSVAAICTKGCLQLVGQHPHTLPAVVDCAFEASGAGLGIVEHQIGPHDRERVRIRRALSARDPHDLDSAAGRDSVRGLVDHDRIRVNSIAPLPQPGAVPVLQGVVLRIGNHCACGQEHGPLTREHAHRPRLPGSIRALNQESGHIARGIHPAVGPGQDDLAGRQVAVRARGSGVSLQLQHTAIRIEPSAVRTSPARTFLEFEIPGLAQLGDFRGAGIEARI